MASPKESEFHISFPLDLGIDNTAQESAVQPSGERAALVESVNTRLSVVRGAPTKAPDFDSISTLTNLPCGGVIPAGNADSSLVVFHPKNGSKRVAGSTTGNLVGTITTTNVASYWPAQISKAGAVPGGTNWKPPATCYDNTSGGTWHAVVRDDGTSGQLTISLVGADGSIIIPPTIAHTFNTAQVYTNYVGITHHTEGDGGNPVLLLFYKELATQSVKVRRITRSGFTLSVGLQATVYTPHASGPTAMAVASASNTYAYVLCGYDATATSVAIVRVTAATLATSVQEVASASASANDCLDIANYIDSGGAEWLGCIVGSSADTKVFGGKAGSLFFSGWGPTALGFGASIVTSSFGEYGSGTYHCFTATDTTAGTLLQTTGTYVDFRTVGTTGTGGGVAISNLGWQGSIWPTQRPVTLHVGNGEAYPLIIAQRLYGLPGSITSELFTTDPSIEVYRVGAGVSGWTPVARLGVDTALTAALASGIPISAIGGAAAYSVPNTSKATFTYLEDDIAALSVQKGWLARFVELDFTSQQPRYAITAPGAAIIAGAMTAQWDGVEVTEVTPIHRPVVHVETTGGSGSTWTNDTYLFSAIFFWVDHVGVSHRSAPAAIRTATGPGLDPIVTVIAPLSLRDGVRATRIECVVYVTEAGGTTLYAQAYEPTSWNEFAITFDGLSQPAVTLNTLYSDGSADQELTAQCPPGFRDVEVVGPRAWGIEAERPNRVWPSKARDIIQSPNMGFEWNSDLRQEFPAHAGTLNAVRESNGLPIFFSDRGIFTITGPGPNNLLEGEFNPPEQLSDQPCTDPRSVVKTPAGILFKSNNRYCLFSGQVRVFDNLDAGTSACVSAFLLREQSEAVIVTSGSAHHVYNYALDRWTIWNSDCVPASVKACAYVPKSGAVLAFCASDIYLSDGETASDTAQMKVRTGDILVAGPQDDLAINDVIIRGLAAGTHGLTVTLSRDYGEGSVTRTFGAGDLNACTVNGQYTVTCSPDCPSMRAIKVTLQETGATGEGFRPLDVTLVGHRNPTTKRDAIKARGKTPQGV